MCVKTEKCSAKITVRQVTQVVLKSPHLPRKCLKMNLRKRKSPRSQLVKLIITISMMMKMLRNRMIPIRKRTKRLNTLRTVMMCPAMA